MNHSKKIAIVDAYSSGKLLAAAFKDRGFELIHVASAGEIPRCYRSSYDPQNFLFKILHEGDISKTVEQLRSLNPEYVLAGAECGVELADLLSERLGLLSNGTKLSLARRDKFEMGEALRRAGLRSIKQIKSKELSEILKWINDDVGFPVVLKPVKSVGADSVTLCNTVSEVEQVFHKIVGTHNQLGILNEFVLVQEFVEGTEYIVNTVSRDSAFYICDVWRCHKKYLVGHGWISCAEELLLPKSSIEDALSSYVSSVLTTLDIKHGPAHFEIMYSKGEPVLIEVGSRVQGAIHPQSIKEATGTNQVELTLEALLAKDKFLKRAKQTREVLKHMLHVFLLSNVSGILKDAPGLRSLRSLHSHCHSQLRMNFGDPITRTIDLFSSCGVADLIHEDSKQIWLDYNCLRSMEEDGFYVV